MRTSYNQANQLTAVTGVDGTATAYTYDAAGLRASATTTTAAETTTEQYAWNALASVPQLLTDATHAYLYGNTSTPLAQVDLTTGGVDYLHTDLLGSIRTTTNDAGEVTSDADYDTYGQPLAVTTEPASAITRFGYAGEYTDPTGYLYLRARYYDPTTAQFLTRDPLEATTNNPYGYTGGNPLQYTDPLGLSWWNPTTWTPDTWVNVGLVLGATALVATGVGAGAALGLYSLAASTSVALGGTAVVTGLGSLALDAGACRDGNRAACAGAAMGATGLLFGGLGLAVDYVALSATGYTFTTASVSGAGAVGSLLFGGTALSIDLLDAFGPSNSCD